MRKRKFTWAALKKAVNKVPDHMLKNEVIIWTDDEEKAHTVICVETLKEDYVFDGDEGCAPKSIMKEAIAEAKKTGDEDEYFVIHQKGTRIIWAE